MLHKHKVRASQVFRGLLPLPCCPVHVCHLHSAVLMNVISCRYPKHHKSWQLKGDNTCHSRMHPSCWLYGLHYELTTLGPFAFMSLHDPHFDQARKFKPTIPQRRKKAADDGLAVKSEPAEDDAFKDLIRAASILPSMLPLLSYWSRSPSVGPHCSLSCS